MQAILTPIHIFVIFNEILTAVLWPINVNGLRWNYGDEKFEWKEQESWNEDSVSGVKGQGEKDGKGVGQIEAL